MSSFFKLSFFVLLAQIFLVQTANAQCPSTAGATKSITDISCFGFNDGVISVTLTSGGTPTNYELYDNNLGQQLIAGTDYTSKTISNGGNTVTFTGLYASSFTVYIYKTGCTKIGYAPGGGLDVNEPTALAASPTTTADCDPLTGAGHNTGTITLNPSGGTPNYTYLWSDGATTKNRGAVDSGTYSVTITDSNGCTLTVSNIVVPGAASITGTLAICGTSGTTQLTGSGTAAVVNPWVSSNTSVAAVNSTGLVSGVALGSTTITYTDSNGCQATATVTVNSIPSAPTGTDVTVCFDGAAHTGSATAGAGESIVWYTASSGGSVTSAPSGTVAGVYTAYAASKNNTTNCESATRTQVTVTINALPTASAGAALSAICQSGTSAAMGGSVGGGATGGTWSGGAGTWTNATDPANATYTASASESGSITLTLTTSGGSCGTATATKSITVNANPTANAGPALSAICQSGTSAAMGGSVGGGATGGTWSGGAGTWTNATDPANATYTASASESGSITLTLTTSGGSCGTATATKSITVNVNPTANAGPAVSAICQSGTSAAMGGSVGGGATGGTWSGGAGTWTNANNPATATYTASASESGSITLTLTTSGGSCGTATATKSITVNANPTANAGPAVSAICQSGTSAAMGGSVGGGATGGTWSGGAGTWTNANNPATATYTASASESGSITLTLTTSGGSCGTATATKSITVNANPTANAGAALSAICQSGTSAAMGGSVGGGATGGTWSGGAGTWTNANNPATATYTASASESGSITLTLTTSGGSCGTATATKSITVNANPTANAGPALSAICQSGTSAAMGGSVGGGATGGTWSGGAGTWTNPTDPANATYTASASESGSITLTLTTSGGSCGTATATKSITVNATPTANAGPALSAICQSGTSAAMGGSVGGGATGGTWSGGAGTWTNPTDPANATYTASASESGSITLTLTTSGGSCGTATATKSITVNATPTANAGPALSAICQSGTSAAMGGSVGGGATGGTWSGGAGTWTNATDPANATYTASASESGSITLTLTTSGGSCGTATATKSITVNANPTANAGPALSAICQSGTSAAMGGSVGGGATGGTWSGGAGTWTNATDPANATYTASASESGSITLTLTTSGGSCGTATATKSITVNANPTANAGAALSAICQSGTSAAMGGSVGGGATGGTWSGGAGTWTNATDPANATYTASASESGSITLTLTTSGGGCGTATATKSITVNANPTATAGPALSAICQSGTSAAMGGSVGGGATGGTWSGGAGTWTNATDPANATYTASASESGSITLTLTTSGGSCGTATATKSITVNATPTANAGPALSAICQSGTSAAMGGSVGGGATGGTWSGGAGTWTNATDPANATYTASASESGSITLTLTTSGGGCGTATATKSITVNANPTANAGPALSAICQSGTSAAMGGSVGGGAIGGTWTGGAGTWTNATDPANATYTASASEIGSITLTLTTSGGSCGTTTATKSITVNANPTANAGPALSAICQSGTSAAMGGSVGGGATGGTWSGGAGTWTNANNPSTATYTASASESGSITLTLTTSGGSCGTVTATKSIIVNALPTATISYSGSPFCATGSVSVTQTGQTGGVYSSSPAGLSINASTGDINLASSAGGTYTVTYSFTDGICPNSTTTSVKVSPLPTASISGTATICSGSSTGLSITLTGTGPWDFAYSDGTNTTSLTNQLSNPFNFNVSPTTNTIYTIISVSDANCTGTATGSSATVTVNATPDATLAVTANLSPLCNGNSTTIDVSNSENGVSYQLRNGTTNVGSAVAGTGSTINLPTGNLSATTTFNVLATRPGCTSVQLTNTAQVTVAGSINAGLSVAAQASTVCSGSGTNIQVSSSENGVNYQLRDNLNNNIGSVVAGNLGTILLPTGNLSANTTFNVLASNGTCSVQLTATVAVSVDVNPNPNLTLGSTIDPLCSGGTSDITVANSENGVSYQLRDNSNNSAIGSPVVGNGGTINLPTGALNATTTFNVLATGGATCPPVQLTGTVTVTVSGSINAGLTITPQASSVCAGSANYGFMLKQQNENFYRSLDFNSSDYATAAVRPKLDITYSQPGPVINSISLQPDGATGMDTYIHSFQPNINLGNNVNLPGTAWTYSGTPGVLRGLIQFDLSSIPANATITSAKLSLYASDGTTGVPAQSTLSGPNDGWLERVTSGWDENTVTWNTQPTTTTQNRVALPASTSSTEDYLNIDVTALVLDMMNSSTTNIDIANSEVGVNYQLRDNSNNPIGSPVAGTGGTISLSTGNLLATTTFNILASSGTCSIQMTTTPTVTVDINPNTSLTTSASVNPVCSGGSTNVTVANSENGVSYQLRDASNTNIGTPVAGNGGTISLPTGALAANTTFNVLATSGVCAAVQLTNTVTVNVGGSINTGLTIAPQNSPICSGTGTNIQISSSEVGVNYQLQDNSNNNIGTAVAGNNGTIDLPTGNLAVTSTFNILASNGTCSIAMTTQPSVTVNASPSAALSVSAQKSSVCPNTGTVIQVANSQVGVDYQLRDNSNNNLIGGVISGTGSTISLSTGNLTVSTTYNVLAVNTTSSCQVQLTTTPTVAVLLATDPSCNGGTSCGAFTNISITDTRPSCAGQNDGTITISVSGGTPFYTVTLYDSIGAGGIYTKTLPIISSGGSQTFITLSPRNYKYLIKDQAGNICGPFDYTLAIQSTVQATASNFVDATCYNQAVGQATVTVNSGGNSPYEYSLDAGTTWVTFTSPVTITNLMPAAAPYSILVRDDASDQCPAQVSVTINNLVADIVIDSKLTDASCLNGDGVVQINSVSGGSGPYSFKFDGGQPEDGISSRTYSGLNVGPHVLVITDGFGCVKTFRDTLHSPGYVDFNLAVTNPTCNGGGNDGKIDVTINTSGNFDVGITPDINNTPPNFIYSGISNLSTPVTLSNLAQGKYYVVVRPNGAGCSTNLLDSIKGGPVAVDFDLRANNFVCFENKGTIDVYNVKGSNTVDYTYEIDSVGVTIRTGTITPLQTLDTVRLPLPLTGLYKGDYQIRLAQDQSVSTGCVAPITSAYKFFSISGPARASFDTVSIIRTVSEYSFATGSATILLENTFAPPYLLNLKLVAATVPGENNSHNIFDKEWVQIDTTRVPVKFVAKDLYAGSYRLSMVDKFGCKRGANITIGVDTQMFIPNIFTPNNDGKNDSFEILYLPANSHIIITNRWGKEVFRGGDFKPQIDDARKFVIWNGAAESDGIYYYTLNTPGKTYTGWIELQR